jgi:hypothetical protein
MNSAKTIRTTPNPSIHRGNCAPATLVKRFRRLGIPPLQTFPLPRVSFKHDHASMTAIQHSDTPEQYP